MRVLVITPNPPSPTHIHGGSTRIHRLYRRLIELGHEVTVAAVFTAGSEKTLATLDAEGFAIRPHVRPRSRVTEVISTLARRPSLLRGLTYLSAKELVSSFFWVDLEPLAADELASGQHDIVVIDSAYAAYWIDSIDTKLPIVLINHEVESVQQMAKAARIGGVGGFLRYMNGRRLRHSERRWSPRYDGIVVMSDDEDRALEAIVGGGELPRTYVVGNGADIDALGAVGPDPDEQRVLFTGTMAYPPNATGAQWLAREVWPRVLESLPEAELEIVGAQPSRATRALGELPGVSVHADVPDMRPWFDRASVCTLPMLEGGGTRLKLADAFAAERAVVSTTNGATGFVCRAGRDLVIADSPEEFARAIVRLLSDASLRARIAANGRAVAVQRYDWNRLGETFDAALQDVIARRSATPINVIVSDRYA
jgi:glycosyltransferase involved in cell wall biosynthesis